MATRLLAGLACVVTYAEGHAHQQFPVTRQYSRTRDFHDSTFDLIEHAPFTYNAGGVKEIQERARNETDPVVLAQYGGGDMFPLYYSDLAANGNYLEPEEIAVRKGVCGDPRLGSDSTKNTYSTPNSEWRVIDSFESGQVIEMDVVVVYYHRGHVEFFLCDVNDLDDPGGVVTQECLNKYPLSRASYTGSGSPLDPSYPGRYYLDPPCRKDEVEQNVGSWVRHDPCPYNVKMRYVLPDIECDRCVLQMHYMTGTRCKHVGYDEFDPASWNSECAPSKSDWIDTDMGTCGESRSYPEEFWACADIELTARATQAPIEEETTSSDSAALDRSFGSSAPSASPSAAPTSGLTATFASMAPTEKLGISSGELTTAPPTPAAPPTGESATASPTATAPATGTPSAAGAIGDPGDTSAPAVGDNLVSDSGSGAPRIDTTTFATMFTTLLISIPLVLWGIV